MTALILVTLFLAAWNLLAEQGTVPEIEIVKQVVMFALVVVWATVDVLRMIKDLTDR